MTQINFPCDFNIDLTLAFEMGTELDLRSVSASEANNEAIPHNLVPAFLQSREIEMTVLMAKRVIAHGARFGQ